MHEGTYATARDMVRAEYGDSTNPMTPNVISYGGTLDGPHPFAFEIASGEGILRGTALVGVSVVVQTETGVERSHTLSTAFSDENLDAALDAALAYAGTLDVRLAHEHALTVAHRLGHEAGVAAGSWLLDGNSSEADAKRLLDGIADGDPEILDALPSAPLSGEWADSPTPDDVIREVESEVEVVVDENSRDDVLRSYEDGYAEGVEAEAVHSARALLGQGVS